MFLLSVHLSGFLARSFRMISKTALVFTVGLLGMVYEAAKLNQARCDHSINSDYPPANSPRIRLSDGRYLAYTEKGVPKNQSKYKIIIVHGFGSSKEMNFLAPQVKASTFYLLLFLFYGGLLHIG